MSLSLWNNNFFTHPFAEMNKIEREMDNMWQSLSLAPQSSTLWKPAVDVKSTDKEYTIHAELPGCKKEDITVEFNNGYLTLSGKRTQENAEENEKYHRVERFYGSFTRSFGVPEGVNESDIKAKFDNGVLEITFPKPQEKKEDIKKITIA